MNSFVIVFRLFGLAIIVTNALQLLRAIRSPAGWRYPEPARYRYSLSRKAWIVEGALGVVAGIAVLAYSFWLFSS